MVMVAIKSWSEVLGVGGWWIVVMMGGDVKEMSKVILLVVVGEWVEMKKKEGERQFDCKMTVIPSSRRHMEGLTCLD